MEDEFRLAKKKIVYIIRNSPPINEKTKAIISKFIFEDLEKLWAAYSKKDFEKLFEVEVLFLAKEEEINLEDAKIDLKVPLNEAIEPKYLQKLLENQISKCSKIKPCLVSEEYLYQTYQVSEIKETAIQDHVKLFQENSKKYMSEVVPSFKTEIIKDVQTFLNDYQDKVKSFSKYSNPLSFKFFFESFLQIKMQSCWNFQVFLKLGQIKNNLMTNIDKILCNYSPSNDLEFFEKVDKLISEATTLFFLDIVERKIDFQKSQKKNVFTVEYIKELLQDVEQYSKEKYFRIVVSFFRDKIFERLSENLKSTLYSFEDENSLWFKINEFNDFIFEEEREKIFSQFSRTNKYSEGEIDKGIAQVKQEVYERYFQFYKEIITKELPEIIVSFFIKKFCFYDGDGSKGVPRKWNSYSRASTTFLFEKYKNRSLEAMKEVIDIRVTNLYGEDPGLNEKAKATAFDVKILLNFKKVNEKISSQIQEIYNEADPRGDSSSISVLMKLILIVFTVLKFFGKTFVFSTCFLVPMTMVIFYVICSVLDLVESPSYFFTYIGEKVMSEKEGQNSENYKHILRKYNKIRG